MVVRYTFLTKNAHTLPPEYVYDGNLRYACNRMESERTHESGWTIKGEIKEDYYYWVNIFEAVHPTLGKVWGDFEYEVFADSEEAYNHFVDNHPPQEWDYRDI